MSTATAGSTTENARGSGSDLVIRNWVFGTRRLLKLRLLQHCGVETPGTLEVGDRELGVVEGRCAHRFGNVPRSLPLAIHFDQ